MTNKNLDLLIDEALDNIRNDRKVAREFLNEIANQIAADAAAYAAAGLNHLIIGFESDDLRIWLDRIEKFATEVIPLAGQR